MKRTTYFADVLLPLPLEGYFTYRIPYELNEELHVGQRVVVQFGKKKIYTALIRGIHETPPSHSNVKYVLSALDPYPIISETQFGFWEWMAYYYMCTPGEVMAAALPSGLKLASETSIMIHPDFDGDMSALSEREYLITETLTNRSKLSITEAIDITKQLKIIPLIKNLIEKKVIIVEEELKEGFKLKKEPYVRLSRQLSVVSDQPEDNFDARMKQLFDELERRAPKQLEILMKYMMVARSEEFGEWSFVKKSELLNDFKNAAAAFNGLVKKDVFEVEMLVESRLKFDDASKHPNDIELTEAQTKAFERIKERFNEHAVCLLHGITSSGKTEIYIKLIQEQLDQGKQILFLLPEIALTTQVIRRVQQYFGDQVGVYHSRYNMHERVEVWNKVLENNEDIKKQSHKIILGPRSALFLPFENLGLIIVDEEHDYSYKQYDPAPRYNARDAAIYLGGIHKAKVLLGTATPSVESYFNAEINKYGLVELMSRYGDIQLPEIFVADVKTESMRKSMQSHFTSFLMRYIKQALEAKEQVILFQNRRGFSLRMECEQCNYMPECRNCDVTLIYHKYNNSMRCHYCGYKTSVPKECPDCGSAKITMKGFGTEKIEEELANLLPDARVVRMDLDTTRSKNAYQRILTEFEKKEIDILVGTQMVTKGLDFDHVSVVGILNADNMIYFPDFRAEERSFQLMEQVSGRAGRKKKQGTVIIQTRNPYHAVIRQVIDHDYAGMYKQSLLERRNFKYPPFYRLLRLSLLHKDPKVLNYAADKLGAQLKHYYAGNIMGPEYPLVSRIKNQYIKNILIKLERNPQVNTTKEHIKTLIREFESHEQTRMVRVKIDVDPI